MCIGGDSSKTDRKQQLLAYGDLNASNNRLNKLGTDLTTAGADATGKVQKYYADILSGDPNRVAAATAPEAKVQQDQTQQLLKQIANFGNRGGGTNQVTANLGEKNTASLIDSAAKTRAEAAEGEGRIGAQQTGQGLSATDSAAQVAAQLLSGSTSARSQSKAIHDEAIRNWASLVEGAITGGGILPSMQNWGV